MSFKNDVIISVLNLPRAVKRLISIICDLSLCVMCVLGAFYLRLDIFVLLDRPVVIAAWVSVCLALPVFWLTGLYRTIFRYSATSIFFSISISITIYALLYFSIFTLYGIEGVPRSIGIIQPMLLFFGVAGFRLFIKFILATEKQKKLKSFKKILIYGAGNSGQQLANSLTNNVELKVIGFLDDDEKLHGQVLQQLLIYNPDHLEHIIKSKNIELVLLALPSIDRFKRNQILEKLRQHKLIVHTLPSLTDIIGGKVTVSDIKELDLNDILDRELVLPKQELIQKNIKDQVVLVTGAGGSIGSELSKQIAKANPKVLILCELNEFSLYKIYDELISIHQKLKIIPLLVNIQDQKKMNEILKIFKVETFYHAAAYKHVPLVESNICEGVLNNVFGTYSVVRACIEQRVLNFVLISSDKAVRPTNVMGATKRLSELCLQALYHQHRSYKINMSMVRFGNVLESSGSVIPKFRQQIKQGGPVTLTHPEVTRYFMTITEAAQLVIQAGAMSKNCDVFILDMGKSIKIKDLIYRIIFLSGLSVRDKKHPEGDIEIKVIGLRPGEKLYEELLLGQNPQPTIHEKIKRAQDSYILFEELKKNLDALRLLCNFNKVIEVKTMLEKIVTTYKSKYNIVDYMHTEQVCLNIPTTKNTSSVTTTSNKVINIYK
jgi:FlaA1/EpsC-like NDP-sugar epimerase